MTRTVVESKTKTITIAKAIPKTFTEFILSSFSLRLPTQNRQTIFSTPDFPHCTRLK